MCDPAPFSPVAFWLESCESGLRASEELLLAADGGREASFASFVEAWCLRGLAGSPCTSVWAVGAIAYRCRTCQTNDSSAICVSCFRAGGHEARGQPAACLPLTRRPDAGA